MANYTSSCLPDLITDTAYKLMALKFLTQNTAPNSLVYMVNANDFTENKALNEAMSMSPETSIYQYTCVHTWFANFLWFLKMFFRNTCQPTIFINFVMQKLLHIRGIVLFINRPQEFVVLIKQLTFLKNFSTKNI